MGAERGKPASRRNAHRAFRTTAGIGGPVKAGRSGLAGVDATDLELARLHELHAARPDFQLLSQERELGRLGLFLYQRLQEVFPAAQHQLAMRVGYVLVRIYVQTKPFKRRAGPDV